MKRNTAPTSPSRCAARRRRKICRPRALPASTKASSMCAARKTLFEACRRCFASIFTDRAISYRIDNGFDHFKVALSVAVMKMVRSDIARQRRHLHARYRIRISRRGLRHRRATASAKPSSRARSIPTSSTSTSRPCKQGFRAVLWRRLGRKQMRMIYGKRAAATRRSPDVPKPSGSGSAFPMTRCLSLARIRGRGSRSTIRNMPACRCRWISNGPRTAATASSTSFRRGPRRWPRSVRRSVFETYALKGHGTVSVTGRAVGEKIAAGRTRLIASARDLARFQAGRDSGRAGDQSGLGAGDEDRGRHHHRQGRPHLPCGDRGARAGHSRRGGRDARDREAQDRDAASRSPAPKATSDTSIRESLPSTSTRTPVSEARAAAHRDHGQCRHPRNGIPDRDAAASRRRPRPHGVHHQRAYRRAPDGAAQAGEDRLGQAKAAIARLVKGYRQPVRFLHPEAGGRRRHDCRGILSASR